MGLNGGWEGVGWLGLDRVGDWGCVHHVDPCGPDIAGSRAGPRLPMAWTFGGFMRAGFVLRAPSWSVILARKSSEKSQYTCQVEYMRLGIGVVSYLHVRPVMLW
jgi:hypothetical protein